MIASRPLPGGPMRRVRRALDARGSSLAPACAKRLNTALVCLALGYALAWIEVPLEFVILHGQDNAAIGTSPLFAAIVARVLLGTLYVFVALRHGWARWLTVSLGLLSAFFVTPMLAGVWQILPAASLITGLGMLCRLVAAVLLALPMRKRESAA